MDDLKFRDREEFIEHFFDKPEEIIRSVARSELQKMTMPKRKKGIRSVIRRIILILAVVISLGLGVFYLPQNLTVTTYSSQNVPHTIITSSSYKPIWHEYRKVSEEGDALFKNQIDTKRLCIEFVTLGIVTGLLYLIFKE